MGKIVRLLTAPISFATAVVILLFCILALLALHVLGPLLGGG
jgi:hypothetical protein